MEKANKKISRLLKVTLLLCMIFSQLATPIEVLADQIVPSYNIDMVLDTENDKFVVTSNGTKELVEDENYILEIIRSFKYTDGTLNEEENKKAYSLVLGSSLNTGVDIEHETFTYNGVSYIDVNVYEITDDTIDFSTYTEEDYRTLLTTDKVENIMNTSFEEGVSYNDTGITFEVTGDSVVCDTTEGYKCNVTLNETNNIVGIKYTLTTGDFNPNKTYYTALKVNGIVTDYIDGDLEVDFSKLLPGVYNVEYSVRDSENNEIISNIIEFTYTSEEEIDRIAFIQNAEFSQEVFYSYTTLTEEEKDTLGNDYRFLDSPLAFIFDSLVLANSETISTDYNLFDEDIRYHVVTGEKLLGAFYEGYDAYKVSDVLENLKVELPQTTIFVVDAEGNEVEETAYVENGMKLVVNILGETLEYDFLVYGDVDGSYVENSDLTTLIDKVLNNNFSYYDTYNLDLNGDSVIDIKDISILGVNLYDQDYTMYEFTPVDTVISIIESDKEELYAEETFEVILSLDGFSEDYINAIEGYVTYDNTALRLDKIEKLNELFLGNSLDNRFIYASTETYSTNNEGLVRLTFTALTEGTHKVSVTDLSLLADGVTVATVNSNELEIKVNRQLHSDANLKSLTSSVGYFNKSFDSETLEYTLYVDSYVNYVTLSGEVNDEYATTEDFKEYALTGDNTQISVNVTAEDGTVRTYKVNVVKVYKSSNNNLKNITIEGYEIDFDKDILEYEITVGSDVTSLDISALVEDYSAWAKIEGNENFQEGENIVTITVYAQDGSTKTYRLLVNKEKAKETTVVIDDEEDEEENNINTEKVVIIILIILVVIGLLYLIFKKDEDEDEPRIEQIKPKKENEPKVEEVKSNNNNNKNNNNNHKKKNKGKK